MIFIKLLVIYQYFKLSFSFNVLPATVDVWTSNSHISANYPVISCSKLIQIDDDQFPGGTQIGN